MGAIGADQIFWVSRRNYLAIAQILFARVKRDLACLHKRHVAIRVTISGYPLCIAFERLAINNWIVALTCMEAAKIDGHGSATRYLINYARIVRTVIRYVDCDLRLSC